MESLELVSVCLLPERLCDLPTFRWIESAWDHHSGESQTFLHTKDVEFQGLKLEYEFVTKVASIICTGSMLGSLLRVCRTRWQRIPLSIVFI